MNDSTCTSAATLPKLDVRKPRVRRKRPVETGIDLLQANPRLSADEARILAEAQAILLRLAGSIWVADLPRHKKNVRSSGQ